MQGSPGPAAAHEPCCLSIACSAQKQALMRIDGMHDATGYRILGDGSLTGLCTQAHRALS